MSTIITVENLGKKYLLKHQSAQQPYVALRDVLSDGVRTIGRRLTGRGSKGTEGADREEFWALKDISFEVKQGDRIGIIGRNGAGKSTLLKILSRITEPTTGSVRIKGRVASLLEVGTGFHPELSGRENIYLNGAILGMSRGEIRKKFDEIVDFAEIEKFLDTPVKRYSSGMHVRLAFAVAAHLEPEILVVDEVLAVGDAQFQKKCLGKMEDVSSREGRTVLFVSHNMKAISRLCSRAIVLDAGGCICDGETSGSIEQYLQINISTTPQGYRDLKHAEGWMPNRRVLLTHVSTHRADGTESSEFNTGDAILIKVGYQIDGKLPAYCQINILNDAGERLITLRSTHNNSKPLELSGYGEIECRLSDIRLTEGEYTLMLDLGRQFPYSEWLDCVPEATRIRVRLGNYLGGFDLATGQGLIAQQSEWVVSGK